MSRLCRHGLLFKIGVDGVLDLMGLKCRPQSQQLLVGLGPPEALGRFLHGGAGPAKRHGSLLPPLHVTADPADGAIHVLDDVGAGQRAAQFRGQTQAGDGEDLADAFQNAGGHTGGLVFQAAGEAADQLLGLVGVVQFAGLT